MSDDRGERRTAATIRQQKQANRDAMVDSAARLFASVGWSATTMEAVAAGAGMSVQSVYFAFGTKVTLLRAALERLTPLTAGRPAEPDPDLALTLLVRGLVHALETTGPLALAAAAAAPGDSEVAEVRDWYDGLRARAAADLVQQSRRRRPLADGVTVRRAVDVVYAVLSPQLHDLLVRERGWSSTRYSAWAADAIGRALWG